MTINTGQAQNFSQTSTRQSTTTKDQNGTAELPQAFNEQRTRLELLSQSSTSLDALASAYTTTESLLRQSSSLNSFSQITPVDTMVAEVPVPTTREMPVTDPKPDDKPTLSPHPESKPDSKPTPSPYPTTNPVYQEPSDSPDTSPGSPSPSPAPDTTPQVPGDTPPLPSENPAITAPPQTLPDFPSFPSFPSISDLLRPLGGLLSGPLGPALAGLGGLLYPSPLGNGELTPDQIADANGMNAMSDEEVQQAVDEPADEYPDYTSDEIKELAKEPNGEINKGTIQETKAALEAEKLGLIEGPILPSVHTGHDFRVGDPPQDWDVKSFRSKYTFDPKKELDKIEQKDLPNDENILFDTSNMTEADIVELEKELEKRPKFEDRYEFVPPR